MTARPEQLDAFASAVARSAPSLDYRRRIGPWEHFARRTSPPAAPLAGSRDNAQLVRAAFQEHYDAMRSAASCRSTAKHPTLDAGEKLELLERADFHHARAERAIRTILTLLSPVEVVP